MRPTGIEDFAALPNNVLIAGLIVLIIIVVLVAAIAWALTQAAKLPPPGLLVVSLSLLTLVLAAIYAITRDQELLTLLGVPIGALAAATSAIYVSKNAQGEVVASTAPIGTPPDEAIPVVTHYEEAQSAYEPTDTGYVDENKGA